MFRAAVLVFLFGVVASHGFLLKSRESARPITRVINLLKDMEKQLQNEQEKDQEIFDNLGCWCKTNKKETTKAISDAESLIAELTATIASRNGTISKLSVKIKQLNAEIAAATDSLNKAQAQRDQALAEFNQDEKDKLGAIGALKQAVVVLEKHHPKSLLEVKGVMKTHASNLPAPQRRIVEAFLQQPNTFQSYAPQSSQIFGILKQMLDTFRTDLSSAQKEELRDSKVFENYKEAQTETLKALNASLETTTGHRGDAQQEMVDAKEQLKDTRESLSSDEEFLLAARKKCQSTDHEFEQRTKTRNAEIGAVQAAIEVLTGDENNAVYARQEDQVSSFIQITNSGRDRAARILAASNNPHLVALSVSVKLDAFARVSKAITDLISVMQKQQEDDVKRRDWLISSHHENKEATATAESNKKRAKSQMETQTAALDKLESEAAALNEKIAETNKSLKESSEEREKESKAFVENMADQNETQRLLHAALDKLASFYGAALVQTRVGPAGFSKYEKNAASGTVVKLISKIIEDSESYVAESTHDEEEAQREYEELVKKSNGAISSYRKSLEQNASMSAEAEGAKADAASELGVAMTELNELANTKKELEEDDFFLKNFDKSQEARASEMNSLRSALDFLRGKN